MMFEWRQFWASQVLVIYIITSLIVETIGPGESTWADWWSYDGISGPEYWGLLNAEWILCNKGKYQSPVDIKPELLVYDPALSPLHVDRKKVGGYVLNTGHDLTLKLDDTNPVFIHGGPLAYRYKIYQIKIHFGSKDDKGSEHLIDNKAFPVEIQFLAFNEDLYSNISTAVRSPHGVTAIAVFAQTNDTGRGELNFVAKVAKMVRFKGDKKRIKSFHIQRLVPNTQFYMTYDGSMTFPPCHEVVTWIVMNRPITITKKQLSILRSLNQVDRDALQVRMENNFRKTVPLSNRTIRTNIQFHNTKDPACSREKRTNYKMNARFSQ